MTVLSALYLIYVISSESTTLVADAVGGDPGGKVLPLFMGAFLFLGFLYITLTERPDGHRTDKGTIALFLLTLGLSVLYVFLLKEVGFIIMTSILLYILEYVYTTIGEKRSIAEGTVGGAATLAVTCGVYLLMRFITKNLMKLARNGAIPVLFKSTVTNGVVSAVLVLILTVILAVTIIRALRKTGHGKAANAGLITFATVLLLYVIFKQFFSVSLAPGWISY